MGVTVPSMAFTRSAREADAAADAVQAAYFRECLDDDGNNGSAKSRSVGPKSSSAPKRGGYRRSAGSARSPAASKRKCATWIA
jgi:hypothetical protein